ncbi:MAG: hypothetical protein JWQ94_3548 [Tardiphaga sp.]|jgi:hypothetical protein|nr:hypothetical protein [Tardiphaga sp.]
MPAPAVRLVTERLKTLLPADGTPVLNRMLRLMLSRDFGQSISDELYEKARDSLFASGQIGRLRGPGGQIFLAKSEKPGRGQTPAAAETGSRLSESDLMPHLGRYLNGTFLNELDLPAHGQSLIKDTSQMGPPRGRWARPDYVVITAMRFRVMPGAQLDVHSFELKAELGATDLAVYEALAQTRFTHFGYLVWHLPKDSPAAARLPEITAQCSQHGIGLIRIFEPRHDDGFETILDPVRKTTPDTAVDSFLEQRLLDPEQTRLRAALEGARP